MTHVRITATRLADGRELFYFDDSEPYVSGGATRRLDDPRPLPPQFADGAQGPQMRRDPLTGDWIPMATHRMNRTFLPPADANPLAPARPGAAYSDGEIPDTDYDVVVFENRFPSLARVEGTPGPGDLEGEPLWEVRPADGRCEVICFSPDSTRSLREVSPHRMRTIIEAWASRTAELSQLEGVRQVFPFENRGEEIGVTLHHPHGQIYAYPYLTPRTSIMLERAREHRAATGGNLLADVMTAEVRSGRRVIAQSEHWVAYVPAAGRWPVEIHVAPLDTSRPIPDLAALTDAEKDDLAGFYLEILARCDMFFPDDDGSPARLPYIAGWHQAPVGEGRDDLRLHLQLFSIRRAPGKLKYLAGSESGMAAWISDTTPEKVADRLREVATAYVPAGLENPGDHR